MPKLNADSSNDSLLKIKLSSETTADFSCKNCPIDHGTRPCPKAGNQSSFDFDFNKLLPILQQRFVDVASVYEKSKLQRVNKTFNQLIKSEKYTVVKELIAHSNTHYDLDHSFWTINGYKTHVHPDHDAHLESLKDVVVNKKFNGVSLPDKWITKLLNQNISFYLTKLHISDSNLTGTEFKSLCHYGTLESMFIENVAVEPSPKAHEIAMWTTNIKKFHVNIKNFVCENNWAKYFTQFSDKRSIESFYFPKLSISFNANDFDKFIRTRMLSTKENDSKSDMFVRISFDEKYFKDMKKKSYEAKIDKALNGVFKRVPKVHYEIFSSTDRFIVDGNRGPEKSNRTYFYVNCRAIDALMKEAEEQKISKGLKRLRV